MKDESGDSERPFSYRMTIHEIWDQLNETPKSSSKEDEHESAYSEEDHQN